MKKSILLSIAASIAFVASANYDGPGYYRVKNYKTNRYVSVIDNRGRIDYANTTADLQAIKLQKNFDVVCADPASVLYMNHVSGYQYQVETQGTGIYQIISHYLNLKTAGTANGQTLYNAYGEMDGVVKYLGDGNFYLNRDLGGMVTHAKGDYIKWFVLPIEANSDNFFGIQPTVEYDGKYYTTMLASFPFTPYSDGVKVYTVKNHHNGMILLEELTGTVAAGTPVIMECSTDLPSTNRLTVGGTANAITTKLRGVYFCSSVDGHINRTVYNKETMRVLGICKDGTLGFIQDDELEYIPANKCYIKVPEGSPSEYKFVSEETFIADVEDIIDDTQSSGSMNIYNVHGQIVRQKATMEDLNTLPAGIYIANGKKYIVR